MSVGAPSKGTHCLIQRCDVPRAREPFCRPWPDGKESPARSHPGRSRGAAVKGTLAVPLNGSPASRGTHSEPPNAHEAVAARPPTGRTCRTDTPAGTVNVCSAPVELNVTDVVAAAGAGSAPARNPNRPAVTSDTQPPTSRTHANADRTVGDRLNSIP